MALYRHPDGKTSPGRVTVEAPDTRGRKDLELDEYGYVETDVYGDKLEALGYEQVEERVVPDEDEAEAEDETAEQEEPEDSEQDESGESAYPALEDLDEDQVTDLPYDQLQHYAKEYDLPGDDVNGNSAKADIAAAVVAYLNPEDGEE